MPIDKTPGERIAWVAEALLISSGAVGVKRFNLLDRVWIGLIPHSWDIRYSYAPHLIDHWIYATIELVNSSSNALIASAAKTVDLAFAKDPLICWLRPLTKDQEPINDDTWRWQRRRLRRANAEGYVRVAVSSASSKPDLNDQTVKAVGMLYPSQKPWTFRLQRALPRLWCYILDYFNPIKDDLVNLERLGVLLSGHSGTEASMRAMVQPQQPLWYIEVVAVNPACQGEGLGSVMVRDLINQCPSNAAIYLECTQEANVGFYEKLGFEVVEVHDLVEPKDTTGEKATLWIMLKR